MSILDRILGRAPSTGPQITATPQAGKSASVQQAPAVPSAAPVRPTGEAPAEGLIRVYDQFGRAVQVGRESWRKDVLLPNLQASRDEPEALFQLIVGALNDDFAADALESARHLAAHDPRPPRATALLGAVLMQLKEFASARDVLERALARHPDDAYLLANLARAWAALGDEERAQKLIWLALQLEPNEEGSLNWLITLAQARGGAQAVLDAYARAALLPGSWRAQLWLARNALERGDLGAALALYEEALGRANPVPADLLMQMSGDLGNRGHTQLLVQLTQPRFDALLHGLLVGNNLLRAYIELGLLPEARKLLEQLYGQQRPDWREHLEFWEQKLDEADKRYGEVTAPLELVVMKLEEPIWARGVLGFEAVLPDKLATAPRVHFVCGSGEGPDDSGGKVVSQPTNDLGRLTRALPLFLAEELHVRTNLRTAFLLPWMKQGGFVLSARPWSREFLPADDAPADLVVFLHVDARADTWQLELRIEHTQGAVSPLILLRQFRLANAGEDAVALRDELLARIGSLLEVESLAVGQLATPPAVLLPGYLAALEQALAVGMAARQEGGASFLYQERAIFDHLFDVALHAPDLLRPRLLLVNALENQARRRKDMVVEYLEKLMLLQRQHELPAGIGANVVARGVATLREKARG